MAKQLRTLTALTGEQDTLLMTFISIVSQLSLSRFPEDLTPSSGTSCWHCTHGIHTYIHSSIDAHNKFRKKNEIENAEQSGMLI